MSPEKRAHHPLDLAGPPAIVTPAETSDPSPPARFLTIDQVAGELNVSAVQIRQLLRAGDLIGIQIGGRLQWRIERVMLEQYIAEAYRRTRDRHG